jgi:hypothetical protein
MAFIGSDVTPAEFSELKNGIQISGGDITDGDSNVIYNQTQGYVPTSILQHTTLTINSGNGLQNGGDVSLNGSTTLDIKTSDIVGTYLSQSSDVLSVNISDGLTGDGSDNIIVDEDYAFGFSKTIDFSSGLNTQADITNGTTKIWDNANGYIPQTTLENDSLTITAGDGLSDGGTPSLGGSTSLSVNVSDFAGGGLQDDGTGDLELVNTDISINGNNGLSGGTAPLGGSASVGISGSLELDGDLVSSSTGSNQTIYDESAAEILSDAIADPLSLNTLNADTIGDNGASSITFDISGTKRAEIDNNGNVDIEGELTEGAAL